ncbi:MAG: alpha/beta hydrolase family protein [Muribaculaceae bacterium]|nr:alpha/beta hydrolase family protein [Muribaculaceae bacterium]
MRAIRLLSLLCAMSIGVASLYARQKDVETDVDITQFQCDTVEISSRSMNREIKNLIILPAQYFEEELNKERFPVVYLLNGYSGNYLSWKIVCPEIEQLATDLEVIFVCPDGQNCWYWDIDDTSKSLKMETYTTQELITYIDNHYRTIASPEMRAITGMSMGGHGALWLAMRHPHVFTTCGSMSGVVDITESTQKQEITNLIGSDVKDWYSHSVVSLLPTLKSKQLNIIIDCGNQDPFYKSNYSLHQLLLQAGIEHDYIQREGAHTRAYWNNAIDYQLLYFSKIFEKYKK